MKSNVNRLFFVFASIVMLLGSALRCEAVTEHYRDSVAGPFTPLSTRINATDPNYAVSGTAIKSCYNNVALRVIDNAITTSSFTYSVTLRINYSPYNAPDSTITIDTTLTVTYNSSSGGSYQGLAICHFTGAYSIQVIVASTSGSSPSGAVELTAEIAVDRIYPFTPSQLISPSYETADNLRQMLVTWSSIQGADEYDLEWTTINDGNDHWAYINANLSAPNTDTLDAVFRSNASRITLTDTGFSIAMMSTDSLLLVRVRQVQYNANGVRQAGDWDYSNNTNYAIFPINWNEPNLNWQYSAAFAEQGKKKEVTSYFDGTLRGRQTVTLNNTDTVSVAQENVYDYFGRPSASILPAPYPEPSLTPYLHYIQNLNVNQVDSPYVYKNVLGSRPAVCQLNPDSLSTDSGASRYYSANNFFIGQNPGSYYIPDAAGFPLSVTQYTGDNTGRIRSQGGVGKQFQPGKVSDPTQNQTTKYYYAKPDQWELDQLFANDAGYAEHYLKNMVVDPNGQISISYLNASGKTIATALTGQAPAMVDTLPSYSHGRATLSQLLKPSQFVYDATALTFTASATFLASTVGVDTMSFSMQQLIDYYPGTFKICSNCYYLFSATLTDDCGNVVGSIASTALGSAVADSTASGNFGSAVAVPVNSIGEYNVTVKLAFDNNVIQAYADTFVSKAIDSTYLQRQFDYMRRHYLDSLDLTGCYQDCHTCEMTIGTQGDFVAMLQTQFTGLGVDTTTSTDTTFSRWAGILYTHLKAHCDSISAACAYTGPCDATKSLMLDDVSPGGQYALFVDSTGTPLEPGANVIADSTAGTPNWRIVFPPEPPTDSAYMANQFQLPDGTYTSPNAASFTLQQLVNNWNPNWANAFLQYHPEYCQLQFCENNAAYEGWDQYVQNDITTAALVPKIPNGIDTLHYSYTNSPDWLLTADPFFKSGAPGYTYHAQMDSDLTYYSERILNIPDTTAPNKGLMAFIDYKLYCQDTTGNMNEHTYPDSSWNCTPNNACRVSNREWLLYQQFYFEAKQKYYNLLEAALCGSYCPVGQPVTSPLPGACPVASDFSVQLNNDTTVTACTGQQAVAIVHNPGSITQDSVRVSIYYPPNTAGLDTLVTFYGGDSQEIICVPDSIPVSGIRVHQVYCGGLPTFGNDTTWTVHVSVIDSGIITPPCPPYADQVRTMKLWLTGAGGHLVNAVRPVTVQFKFALVACDGTLDTITRYAGIPAGQSSRDSAYFGVLSCEGSCASPFHTQIASCINRLVNANIITSSDAGLNKCVGYTYTNPQTPPVSACPTALSVKTPRFPNITYTPAGQLDTITNSSQLINPTLTAIQTQGQDMCTGEAMAWIAALQPGLDTIHASAGLIDTLRNALISICSAGVDLNHPVGASTLSPDTTGSYASFGDAIKDILLDGGSFTTLVNPWLIDSPNPYITPSNGSATGAQVMTQTTSNSNASICALLSHLDSLATTASQTLYHYLSSTYGTAMTLDSLDLVNLQNSCTNCRFLLSSDLTLPVFLEPGAQGCVPPAAYAAALDSLNSQFGRTLLPTDTNYMVIRTNYLNQYFGFGLSYDQYNDYDTLLVSNPSATLCNVPPYTTTNANPYDCVQNNISVVVANGLTDWNNYIAASRQAFINDYEKTCSLAQPAVTRNSLEQLYHYTLYYYDQADNLVRTIPPEGVTLVDSSRFSYIDRARDIDTLGLATYNGPTTDAGASAALDTLSDILSAPQGAVELWLYNNGINNYHVVAATPDNKYLCQAGIAGDTLSVDVFPMTAPGSTSIKLLPVTGHYVADISALQPLNPFALLVFQGDTLGKGPNNPQVYLNGIRLTLLTNPQPAPLSFTVTGNSTSVTLPDSIQTLKHMRLYRHLLSTATIQADAANPYFYANDTGYAGWFRFNVPAAGSPTTVNDTSTLETAYYDTFPSHALPTTYAYNGTNQVVQQLSPDGGTNRFWYDLLSRLVVSQNDKQYPLHNYSYTIYDTIGRIIEVGQKYQTTLNLAAPHYLPADSVALFYTAGANSQITDTYYDNPLDTISGHTDGIASIYSQYNLRKRVAASTYTQTEGSPVLRASYYTYDIDGNVSSLWQQLDGLYQNSSNAGLKRIDYEYDLVSGKVNFVRYQDGQPDAFYYGYNYDADNRIVSAWTSPVALVDTLTGSYMPWPIAKQDAQYYYYLHGPLRRMELGTQGSLLQGLDYAYTVQGWLKGVNSADGDPNIDMGQDGTVYFGGANTVVSQDAYAYSLGYYTGDYTPIGGTDYYPAFALTYSQTTGDITGQSLYNGNISNTTLAINAPSAPSLAANTVGYTYHYDQLNRLKKLRQYTGIAGTGTWDRTYITLNDQENITYDGNGNILTYGRNGGDTTAQTIDSLTYNYNYTAGKLVNNQLQYIHDAVTSSGYNLDLRNQTNTDNYQYDGIGNITKDIQSGITNIGWTVYNKPDTIYKSAGNITYNYNTANERISKTYNGLTTWYVRDAQGNVMGIYDNADSSLNWREQHLYGSSRLGMWTPNVNLADSNALDKWDTTGYRHFELDNHLGNVLATINDVRNPYFEPSHIGPLPGPLQYFTANVLSSQDYYAFGMLMPDRQYTLNGDSTYRYGFNGKENDNEVMGLGNFQDYGARFLDNRVNRFFSVDPLSNSYPELSSYQFASNSPIRFIDADGQEASTFGLDVYTEASGNSNGNPQFIDYAKAVFTVTGNNINDAMNRIIDGVKGTVTHAPMVMANTMKDVTKSQQDEAQYIMHRGQEYQEIKQNGGDYNDVEKQHQYNKISNEIKIAKDGVDWFGIAATGIEANAYGIIETTIARQTAIESLSGTLSNTEARQWYLSQESKIPTLLTKDGSLEIQAKEAFALRNQFRSDARKLMSDRVRAKNLIVEYPNMSWKQIIKKYSNEGYKGDDIYKEIIKASQRSNQAVNKTLGL